MKIFNKIWVIIDILIIIPLLTVLLAMPDMSIVWLRQGLDVLAPRVTALDGTERLIMAATAVALDLLLLILLYYQLRKPPTAHARVKRVDGGVVEISLETIRQRLLYHLANVSDVLKATPHIDARGDSVDVQVAVETSPHVIVPDKAAEIVGVIRRALEDEMGLKMRHKPEVRIYHGAFREVGPAPLRGASGLTPKSARDSTLVLPDTSVDAPPSGRDEPPDEPADSA